MIQRAVIKRADANLRGFCSKESNRFRSDFGISYAVKLFKSLTANILHFSGNHS